MGYYLLDHPNPHGPHYHTTRRGRVLAIVVHITAGLEDLDATDDHSAENTARYAATTDRQVSWHSGSDSDSALDLLPAGYTAFHCVGYNSTTYGHEISKADPDWRNAPEPWRTRTLTQAARHLGAKARQLGIPIRKATKADLDHAIATGGQPVGFISHAELDPARRRDPGLVPGVGDTFPWNEFLAIARGEEADDMGAVEQRQIATLTELCRRIMILVRDVVHPLVVDVRTQVRNDVQQANTVAGVDTALSPERKAGSGARQGVRQLANLGVEDSGLDDRLAHLNAIVTELSDDFDELAEAVKAPAES